MVPTPTYFWAVVRPIADNFVVSVVTIAMAFISKTDHVRKARQMRSPDTTPPPDPADRQCRRRFLIIRGVYTYIREVHQLHNHLPQQVRGPTPTDPHMVSSDISRVRRRQSSGASEAIDVP